MEMSQDEKKRLIDFCRESLKYFINLEQKGTEIRNIDIIKKQYKMSDEELYDKAIKGEIPGIEKIK